MLKDKEKEGQAHSNLTAFTIKIFIGYLEAASSSSGGGLFPDNEEGTDPNDISERVLHLGPNSLGEFKETFKNGFQVR